MTYTTIMANYDGDMRSYTVFRKCCHHGMHEDHHRRESAVVAGTGREIRRPGL